MADEFKPEALLAQKEFDLIQDLLRTPLREDLSKQVLPDRRRWSGGCLLAVDRPDLIPFNPRVDPTNSRQLLVNVKNQGDADAGRFYAIVTYNPRGKNPQTREFFANGGLEKGGIGNLFFEIPDFKTDEGCEFEVFVDSKSDVAESNEDNNKIAGNCNCCGTGEGTGEVDVEPVKRKRA